LVAEVVGDLIALQLNRLAISSLQILPIHTFLRTGILRGHHLFAQVNSLAVAVMDADLALTAKTELRFHQPVYLGQTVIARVDVLSERGAMTKCQVRAVVDEHIVLDGVIWVQREVRQVAVEIDEKLQLEAK
jgi:acyl-coenzyme A thioesterase PaaI-like protein